MNKKLSSNAGVTLVEILIGVVISMIMMAAMFGYKDVVELLIESGADLSILVFDCWTVLDFTIAFNYPEIQQLLEDEGAESGECADWSGSGSGSGSGDDYDYIYYEGSTD